MRTSINNSMIRYLIIILILFHLAGCLSTQQERDSFVISAIPDQDPEVLQRLYGNLENYLQGELGVEVVYKPVLDYTAAVTAFRTGDLDMVWFGGLTGVQARLQVTGAEAIVQRDIDAEFHSIFIANKITGLEPFQDPSDLVKLRGFSFTFGSELSTSGRLMPQYFLEENGINLNDFAGPVGFSGSHDKTIKLIEAGVYDVGVLNLQVWESRLSEGQIDDTNIIVLWITPPYADYHWVINIDRTSRFGPGFKDKVVAALLKLDDSNPTGKEILDMFGASKFIPTNNENYNELELIAKDLGLIK